MKYFAGDPSNMGVVTLLPQSTFADLCTLFRTPQRLRYTRAEFAALPKKDKTAPDDQQRAKRVRYITPAEFKSSPAQRVHEHAVRCNLIALDIDEATEAKRLLAQRWESVLGTYAFCVWHTASSTPEAPRLRLIVSANGLQPDRYVRAARTIAELVGVTNITSGVTFHCVQPMFLPTVFRDDDPEDSPIVACSPDGDAFTAQDVIADEDSSFVDSPAAAPNSDAVADLAFLRAPMTNVSIKDVEDALKHLDPDMPMQQWIEVAAGIKHQFDDAEGFRLWDEWSAKGAKYVDSEETEYRWKSLKAQPTDRAPVTIRTVFKRAQERGWTNPTLAKSQHAAVLAWLKSEARSSEQLLDEGPRRIAALGPLLNPLERKTLIVAMKDRLADRGTNVPVPDISKEVRRIERDAAMSTGIPAWAKGLCFVTSENVFYRPATGRKFKPEVLDLMYSAPPIGEDKPMRPRDYMIQVAGCAQVEALRYDPTHGDVRFFNENGVPFVNTYRADFAVADPSRADEAGEIVTEHIANLIENPDYGRLLLSWIAFMKQHPGKKIRWSPLIQSAEGAGKTVLHELATVILGRRNTTVVNGHQVMDSQWTDWAEGRQLVTLEEVRIIGANRHTVMDKLKPLIANSEVSIARKWSHHATTPNVTNYLLLTNHQDALAIREDGRRYFVLASRIQTKADREALGGQKYFDRIYDMMRDNPGGLCAWFQQYPLHPKFNPNGDAPVTEFLKLFAANSASPLAAAVAEAIEDNAHALVSRDLVSLSCLRGCLNDKGNLPPFTDQALAGVLRDSGWVHAGRFMVEGARHQLWTKGPFADVRATAETRLKFL